jgi:hypothetical protein
VLQHRIEIHDPGLKDLSPTERQQLAGNGRSTLGSVSDVFHVLAHRRRQVGTGQDEAGGTQHDRHLVVGLVCHPAGQLSHHFDPLRLPQPVLGTTAFGDIEDEEHRVGHLASQAGPTHENRNSGSVFPQELLLVWRA